MATAQPRKRKRVSPHKALLNKYRPFYDWMLEQQGGTCGICGSKPSEKRRLDMDHDHKQMFIRGLLCHMCNRALTYRVDNPEWLRAAAAYLDRGPVIFPDA